MIVLHFKIMNILIQFDTWNTFQIFPIVSTTTIARVLPVLLDISLGDFVTVGCVAHIIDAGAQRVAATQVLAFFHGQPCIRLNLALHKTLT